MEVQLVAALAALVGLVVGAGSVLAVRLSERGEQVPAPSQPVSQPLPPGIASVLAVLPSSAVVLDSDDRVLRASSAARAFGMVRGDRLVVDSLLQLAGQVRRNGEIRETTVEIRHGRFGRELSSFAVRIAPLAPWGLVLVLAEDQTELRRVEAVRRDFVANVSHELKTPVGALALLAETLEQAADDPDAVRRFTGRMQHEAVRLNNLVQDLIVLSRIQGGDPVPEPKPVRLGTVVAEAVDRCRLKATAKEISLVVAGDDEATVRGDEQLLATALHNLIANAIAYSPERTRVSISSRTVEDIVEISVSDQGIGIPARDLQRIFERFYRADAARSRATGGTGLGLAIVKHVATNHGGEVTVWSKEGIGSTFTIRLPLRDRSRDAAPRAEPRDAAPRAEPREDTLREARS